MKRNGPVDGHRGAGVIDLGPDIDRFIWNPGVGTDAVDGLGLGLGTPGRHDAVDASGLAADTVQLTTD
jgi:hypothetical protein